MDRAQKKESIEWISDVFENNTVVVVANGGLSVSEMTALRGELRQVGAQMKIVKNRLAKIAITGKPFEKIGDVFTGPTAIAFAEDPSSAAKAVKKYAKTNDKLSILGGAMGEEVFDANGVDALASMPSREELLGSIVHALTSQGSNILSAVGAPAADLAGIVKTIEERDAA